MPLQRPIPVSRTHCVSIVQGSVPWVLCPPALDALLALPADLPYPDEAWITLPSPMKKRGQPLYCLIWGNLLSEHKLVDLEGMCVEGGGSKGWDITVRGRCWAVYSPAGLVAAVRSKYPDRAVLLRHQPQAQGIMPELPAPAGYGSL